jgi:hypothetical protein
MNDHVATLERHLSALVRLNDELLTVVRRRAKAIAARDVVSLERLMACEREVATAIFEEEQKRRMTMVRLAGPLQRTAEDLSEAKLTDVLQWLPEGPRRKMMPLAARLKQTAGEVQQVNRESALLTQKFLPYFEELLGILVEGVVGHASYTAAGHAARSGSSGMNVLDVTV